MTKITKNKYFIPLIIFGIIMIAVFGKLLAINYYEPELTRYTELSASSNGDTLTFSRGIGSFRTLHTADKSPDSSSFGAQDFFRPADVRSGAPSSEYDQPVARFIIKQIGLNPSDYDFNYPKYGFWNSGKWLNDLSTQMSASHSQSLEEQLGSKFSDIYTKDNLLKDFNIQGAVCRKQSESPSGI